MRNLLEREPLANQAILASFFYSYRDRKLHTNHANMLRSILYDVLHENENFFFHFQSLYRKTIPRGTWPYDSLKNILLSFKKHPTVERLYLIIDAMDESDDKDRRDIITLLRQLCGNEHSTCVVKIFVASRPITGLNHNVAEIEHIIKMQDENGLDILKFAESFLGKLKLSAIFHRKTKDYIIQYAQGVFVWVYLVQNELLLNYHETGYRNQDIYDFLRSLPTELEAFYERMFRKLEGNQKQQDTQDGVRMFQLVLFSFRPLKAEEIQQALAIPHSTDMEYLPSDELFENRLIQEFPKRIIHCGGNFLEIKGIRDSPRNPTAFSWLTRIQEMVLFNLCIKQFTHSFPDPKDSLQSL
jgi:hypothetical protein